MANITVSTSSNFDDAANLALNHNETVTVTSGATLTLDSDNRYAQNSAAPMTITISEGAVVVDGRNVWWLPFDASSGTVPALSSQGTLDVTVGGVAVGELLGIWDAYATPKPLDAGVAMPASGFVKLRRKVAAIADNDVLTFGGGATATVNSATGGQRGWIDLVGTSVYTANFLSGGIYCNARSQLRVYGDWFELGETTGVAGQVVQHYLPIYCSGVQIETAPGSGVYEWYVSFPFNTVPNAALVLDNNIFGRAFTSTTTGAITLGYNAQFYVPPAGCKIRVPNVCLNSVIAGSYDTYATAANNTTTWRLWGGVYSDVQIDKLIIGMGRFHSRNSAKYYITNSTFMGGCMSWNMQLDPSSAKDWKFENVAIAAWGTSAYSQTMFNISGDKVVIKDALLTSSLINSPWVTTAPEIQLDNVTVLATSYWVNPGSLGAALYFRDSKNVSVNKIRGYAPGVLQIRLDSVENFDANDIGIVGVDIFNGVYTGSGTAISGTGVKKARFNDFKNVLGKMGGGFDHFATLAGEEIVWSNFGSFSNPYVLSDNTAYRNRRVPQYSWNSSTVTKQSMHNVWISSVTGGALYNINTTSQDVTYNYCGVINPNSPYIEAVGNPLYINSRLRNTTTTFTSGTEYIPYQHLITALDQTTSQLVFAFQVFPTADVRSSGSVTSSGAQRDGSTLYLNTAGAFAEITTDEVLGVTALLTVAITSTGSLSFSYDIDFGTGFSGTYKTLNNTNVAAEPVSASGFRLRVRAEATAAGTNTVSFVRVNAATSTADIQANHYPVMEPNITMVNVVAGSTLAVVRNSTGKVLFLAQAGGTSQVLRPGWSDNVGATTLVARKPGYASFALPYALTYRDDTIPVNQAAWSLPDTNPGSRSITVTNHGASPVTWNGKSWSITVAVTDGSTPAQIAHWLAWQLAQDSYSLGAGVHNMAWPDMVVPAGTGFETVRGTLFGSAGSTLKGVRVVDGSGNEIPGFARMQADDGTYYSPAASYTLTVAGIVSGSRLLLRRTDTGAVIANTSITGTTFTHTYVHTVDIPVEIVVRKATGSPAYQEWRTTTTLAASNNSQTANQLLDE